jgi:uncharacterized protein YjlB
MKRREVVALGVGTTLGVASPALAAPESLSLPKTAEFPNSRYPALIYRAARNSGDLATAFEDLFESHGWSGSWRNGLYRRHHFHSTAHEVLGVYRGHVNVRLGGPSGTLVVLRAGDVAVVPAGVAHKNEAQSEDFAVVGAYPRGTSPDLRYGEPGERSSSEQNIAKLSRPEQDPVAGAQGALTKLWR